MSFGTHRGLAARCFRPYNARLGGSVRIIVVGTGTDVGKTHVSACLLAHARSRGLRVAAYKPIATGVAPHCEDADRLAEALGVSAVMPTYSYVDPISPHRAARLANRPIDIETIARRADELANGVEHLLIESAGGLFSPLAAHPDRLVTNLDLVKRLMPAVVLLVASDRIGVLHDISACNHAASAAGMPLAPLVLSAPAVADPSTGTNAEEIVRLGFAAPLGAFPRAPFDAPSSLAPAAVVWECLEKLSSAP